jgi:hypothetical protein
MRQLEKMCPRIARRVADLWMRMLADPQYDYLGSNATAKEVLQQAVSNSMLDLIAKNNSPEILEKFGKALFSRLMDESVSMYERCGLHVNYGPDSLLTDAANAAGLKMEFPYKTNMWINAESISLSYGYGAESVYHYPLENGRWLVTKLSGSDISKVIQIVNGETPEFFVEEAAEPAAAA